MADQTEDIHLSRVVKDQATRFAAPPDLRVSISAALAQSAAPARSTAASDGWLNRSWLKLGAALACGFVASMLVMQLYWLPNDAQRIREEVVSAHVQSLMAAHLYDIASSDQHTVKPWFAGKLDFAPPVNDFAGQGYSLAGGRLAYVDKHLAAALVYQHRGHVINVFVWPVRATRDSGGTEDATALMASQEGFNLSAWIDRGLQFWIISDLNREDLNQFSRLVRSGGA